MVNVPLLEQTMQHIKDFPELHFQDDYFHPTECGTAMCFAGRACQLSGMKQIYPGTRISEVMTPRGVRSASVAGADVLGLSGTQADTLFWGTNTRTMLEAMVKDFANDGTVKGWEYYRDLVS